ncbi:transposase family protein [Saccharopolyspora pogona]|uniref:transposase family protein n=1 Tax=Saccharopolyspora pogona TaxID=333966 RepID=UPI001CC26268|nr:transposase family protein [Saccharopolyspora pogona]
MQTVEYQRERRLAKARNPALPDPPTEPNQLWQLDFSEFETTTGGVWRIAGCADYFSKYEFGWDLATTCNAGDAVTAVEIAIAEAERLASGVSLVEQLTDPVTGKLGQDQAGHRQQ